MGTIGKNIFAPRYLAAGEKISAYVIPGLSIHPDDELRRILSVVCSAADITVEQACCKSRLHQLVLVRQIYCYIARNNTGYCLNTIGSVVDLHYSSVIHSVGKINDMIAIRDSETLAILKKIC